MKARSTPHSCTPRNPLVRHASFRPAVAMYHLATAKSRQALQCELDYPRPLMVTMPYAKP